jgi:hypothetical protein
VDSSSLRLLWSKEIILCGWSVPNLLSDKAVFDNLLYALFFTIVRAPVGPVQPIIRAYDYILIEHLYLSIGNILMILEMIGSILLVSLLVPCMQPFMRTLVRVYDLMGCERVGFIVFKMILLLHWAGIVRFLFQVEVFLVKRGSPYDHLLGWDLSRRRLICLLIWFPFVKNFIF